MSSSVKWESYYRHPHGAVGLQGFPGLEVPASFPGVAVVGAFLLSRWGGTGVLPLQQRVLLAGEGVLGCDARQLVDVLAPGPFLHSPPLPSRVPKLALVRAQSP